MSIRYFFIFININKYLDFPLEVIAKVFSVKSSYSFLHILSLTFTIKQTVICGCADVCA